MSDITKGHLAFMEEAKEEFERNPFQETYRDELGSYIALRIGMDRDCIMVYELGEYVTNFVQQLDPLPLKKNIQEEN